MVADSFGELAASLMDRDGVALGSGRRGFGSDALNFKGRIFAIGKPGSLVLKLPAKRVAELLESGLGVPFDAGKGRPMREWIVIKGSSEDEWQALAEEALRFAGG